MTDILLRYSDNGGQDWSIPVAQAIAPLGSYDTVYQWQRLGLARDRVFEVSWTGHISAVNGAFSRMKPCRT